MRTYIFKIPAFVFLLSLSVMGRAHGQGMVKANTDTSRFSVNTAAGWQILNSYVGPVPGDSDQLELILEVPTGTDWSKEHYIGRIKPPLFRPLTEKILYCPLLFVTYRLRIDLDGGCHLSCPGKAPPANTSIIPIKVLYEP